LIVASAYLPYDSDETPPTTEMRDIIGYCHSRRKQLNVGCDANTHHSVRKQRHQPKRREPYGISGEFKPEYSKPW
jgi:hypothetical protein